MASRPDLADLLTRAVREINSHTDLEPTLAAIVACLHAGLPAGHHVGLCLQQRGGVVSTAAVSDESVVDLEAAQHELDQGTCPRVIRTGETTIADPVDDEQEWTGYLPAALRRGVDAQLSVPLVAGERIWGALTVYSLHGRGLSPDTRRLASLYAVHAAVAVARSHREDNLEAALESRRIIGQAVGLSMERFGLDEELAFRYLVRLSSTGNVKLREVARELVDQANHRANHRADGGADSGADHRTDHRTDHGADHGANCGP
ncbi:ANTAR domain-containing protein [Nocardioides panaciterrulae]|uniref:GAF domain-containing protein n=1 Tax=Nocardioides panaciterrulae TaxID=661492 RepID=A0A7Y9J9R2_9ACTN|nr:GAF domain-containing protein [Nocardioides panaciterrulae]